MAAFFMLLPRILVQIERNIIWEKRAAWEDDWVTSQEYLFSGIWKHIGSVGEAVGWMTGFFYIND